MMSRPANLNTAHHTSEGKGEQKVERIPNMRNDKERYIFTKYELKFYIKDKENTQWEILKRIPTQKGLIQIKKIIYKMIYIHKYELNVLLCEKYPQGFSHVGKTDSDLKIYRFVVR